MNQPIQPEPLRRWETLTAMGLAASTPLVMSALTVDSYLMPKWIWMALLISVWLVLVALQPKVRITKVTAVNWPIAAMLLIFAGSVVIDYTTPIQIYAYLNLLMFVVLFYLFRRFWSLEAKPETLIRLMMLTCCTLALYALLQDYGFDFAELSGGVRDWRSKVIATLGNPNFLAGYLGIMLPVVIAFALRPKAGLLDILYACVTILLMTACIVVTFCVGVTTALITTFVLGVVFSLILFRTVRLPWLKIALIGVIAASSVGWYLLDNPYNSHGRSLYEEAMESPQWWSGMGARQFNWQSTRIMMNEQPCTGIGFGNYLTKHEHYQGLNYQHQWHAHDRDYVIPVDQPHFQLLETASETGPAGVLVISWLAIAWTIAVLRRLRKSPNDRWLTWGCLLGVWVGIVHSFSSFPFHLPASSLAIVVLAAYPLRGTLCQSDGSQSNSTLFKLACFAFALILCVSGVRQFVGNHYLRTGLETSGWTSYQYLIRSKMWNPHTHQLHLHLGIRYITKQIYGKAIEELNEALRYQEDIQCHKYLVEIYKRQNKLTAAITEQRRVIEINPVFPGHYLDLVALLKKANQLEEIPLLEAKANELQVQLDTRE